VTVRIWNEDNTIGITSTTDVDPAGVELALKTAYEASFFGVKENVPDFSPFAPIATSLLRKRHTQPFQADRSLMQLELCSSPCYQGVPQRLGTKRHRQVLPK